MAVVVGVDVFRGYPVLTATLKRLLERYEADSSSSSAGTAAITPAKGLRVSEGSAAFSGKAPITMRGGIYGR